jgi:uncharacterized membrane protein
MTARVVERASGRVQALDVVRGVVMVLMTLDHASGSFNAGRIMSDSAAAVQPGVALDPLQFVARWVTHLCAPTFVFLAGASLALSVTRRLRDRIPSAVLDRDILIRGALLIVLDLVWMGWMWRLGLPIQLGVLYAIGASMIAMIPLRRLPPAAVGCLGVLVMAGGEAVTGLVDPGTTLAAATLAGGQIGPILFFYPVLPWMGFLLLGWAVGMRLARPASCAPDPSRALPVGAAHLGPAGMRARHWLALSGIAAATFLIVRSANGYGNAHLLRADGSWIEWLHVSKYPPSLAYAGLELAIAFGLLAAAWRWSRPWTPLAVIGQTALLYYLLHAHLYKGVALALGVYRTSGLGATAVAWVAMLWLVYPLCRWYLGVKRRHPRSVLRFL